MKLWSRILFGLVAACMVAAMAGCDVDVGRPHAYYDPYYHPWRDRYYGRPVYVAPPERDHVVIGGRVDVR